MGTLFQSQKWTSAEYIKVFGGSLAAFVSGLVAVLKPTSIEAVIALLVLLITLFVGYVVAEVVDRHKQQKPQEEAIRKLIENLNQKLNLVEVLVDQQEWQTRVNSILATTDQNILWASLHAERNQTLDSRTYEEHFRKVCSEGRVEVCYVGAFVPNRPNDRLSDLARIRENSPNSKLDLRYLPKNMLFDSMFTFLIGVNADGRRQMLIKFSKPDRKNRRVIFTSNSELVGLFERHFELLETIATRFCDAETFRRDMLSPSRDGVIGSGNGPGAIESAEANTPRSPFAPRSVYRKREQFFD